MGTPTNIGYFSIAAQNSTVNAATSYTFEVRFQTTHYTNDKVILTFPSEITIGAGFQCSAVSGLALVSCTQTAASQIAVTLTFSTFPSNYTVSFQITMFTNNWVTTPSSISLTTTTNDTSAYLV